MRPRLHRLATWLALVAYALSGVAPARQLVLCVEPDGTVAVEAAEADGCTPCGAPGETTVASADDCCPCLDIPLPLQGEDPLGAAQARRSDGPSAAVVPPARLAVVDGDGELRPTQPERVRPRVAPRLALIRTVVLRV